MKTTASHALSILAMFFIAHSALANNCQIEMFKDSSFINRSDVSMRNFYSLMNRQNYEANKESFNGAFEYSGYKFTGDFDKDSKTIKDKFQVVAENSMNISRLIENRRFISNNGYEAYAKCLFNDAKAVGLYTSLLNVTPDEVTFSVKYVAPPGGGTVEVTAAAQPCVIESGNKKKNGETTLYVQSDQLKTIKITRNQSKSCILTLSSRQGDSPSDTIPAAEGLCERYQPKAYDNSILTPRIQSNEFCDRTIVFIATAKYQEGCHNDVHVTWGVFRDNEPKPISICNFVRGTSEHDLDLTCKGTFVLPKLQSAHLEFKEIGSNRCANPTGSPKMDLTY